LDTTSQPTFKHSEAKPYLKKTNLAVCYQIGFLHTQKTKTKNGLKYTIFAVFIFLNSAFMKTQTGSTVQQPTQEASISI
jgi:hypothetical protein